MRIFRFHLSILFLCLLPSKLLFQKQILSCTVELIHKDIALLLTKTVIREDAQKPLLYKLHTATTKLTIYPSTDYDSYITQGELSDEYEVVEF